MSITTAGMTDVANLIGTITTASGHTYRWIGIGTSATAFATTQTLLVAETGRMASTTQTVATTILTTVVDAFSFSTLQTIQEVGLFGIATSNTAPMLCRALTGTPIVCATTDTLKVTITVEVKQGA